MARIAFRCHASILAVLAAAAPAPALAQTDIVGVVQDAVDGAPVGGVALSVLGVDRAVVLTDQAGRFRLIGLPAGALVLQIRHPAYAERTDTLAGEDGRRLQVLIRLTAQALPLEPLSVEARSRNLVQVGFFDRRARGFGAHFTREQIQERGARRLSDLLAGVSGIRRNEAGLGQSRIAVRGTNSIMLRCDVQYFLDGVAADISGVGVDAVRIDDIEGVEIYRGPSELPSQFDNGRSSCGAVLIWTRLN